ncbi:imidazole glycerol phosphate synthase subunit HisH [Mesorhizobium sp. Z1-4]|uniref:imidazole glycerol phosphate synthase subunit HisH n=1 Tax=Mesorhizobium sp. Z1-4 TaxID=2448478 RepID=UPI000FDBB53C|nr:imidazole glycerol phosphate synthase subunit HisH [Mesorhizobium sp. Z1-4]
MIVIVDYGLGNLGSIRNMLRKIGYEATVSGEAEDIRSASKLILPGIGAFDSGMRDLNATGVVDILHEKALEEKIPVLGICLGAQLMTKRSDEGKEAGLGWFEAETRRMTFEGIPGRWPLPNIGWRDVKAQNGYSLLDESQGTPRFYFVHSYYMHAQTPEIVSMTSEYGFEFACGLSRGNLHCAQFHPEKSHVFGKRLLQAFAELEA